MTQTIQEFEPVLRESATFDRLTIQEIQRAAATGIYDIRGGGTKRKVPHFDDSAAAWCKHVTLPAGRLS